LVDGNKRIAFVAMMTFLIKNGVAFSPDPAHATTIILSLAAGEISEESLTRWIRDNWPSQ
jgi:death-on-curing protein